MKYEMILENTRMYRIGEPFKTGAVVNEFLPEKESLEIKYFESEITENSIVLRFTMGKNDRIFGLGEMLGSLNKRGKKYTLYSKDDPFHTPDKEGLYGVHPFIIIDGEVRFGLFIDFPGEMVFDIGFTHKNTMEITITKNTADIYIFDTYNMKDITKKYMELTGKTYVPPKWAFGYQQCRWSYPDESKIREIAENFRKHNIPCDAIYMDIDYMERYKVFSIDSEKFKNFGSFVGEMKDKGFRLVPIIDPGVKIESGYDVYEDGIEKNTFCTKENGEHFTAAVWPGPTHFPDFLNSKTRKWWGDMYKRITDFGIEGFWNDMNEPAIFYTPDRLKEVFKRVDELKNEKELGIGMLELGGQLSSLTNRREYFSEFYQVDDNGVQHCHDDVHNLYGFGMTLAAAEGMRRNKPNDRYLLLSRSSYSGMHRFGAVWMGDNASWWEHLGVHIKMLQSLNMSGFNYSGADVGGFGANSSPELVIRWMQLGALTPLYRNHSALGTRDQEPWAFDNDTTEILRAVVNFRYALLPYYYSEFMKARDSMEPFISAMFLKYDSNRAKESEDQFFIGESIMAAPVHTQNSTGRFVYLPEGKWMHWSVSDYKSRNIEILDGGNHYISADIERIPLFVGENKMIVLGEPAAHTGDMDFSKITVIAFVTDKAVYNYYEDDGATFDYEKGVNSLTTFTISRNSGGYDIDITQKENGYKGVVREIEFEIYNEIGEVHKVIKKVK